MKYSKDNKGFKKFLKDTEGIDAESDMEIFEISLLEEFKDLASFFLTKKIGIPLFGFDYRRFKDIFNQLKKIYDIIKNTEPLFYEYYNHIRKEIINLKTEQDNAVKIKIPIEKVVLIRRKFMTELKKLLEILSLRLIDKKINFVLKCLKKTFYYNTFIFLKGMEKIFYKERYTIFSNINIVWDIPIKNNSDISEKRNIIIDIENNISEKENIVIDVNDNVSEKENIVVDNDIVKKRNILIDVDDDDEISVKRLRDRLSVK